MDTVNQQFARISSVEVIREEPRSTMPDLQAVDSDSDSHLFLQFRDDGDESAFERLFRRHRDALVAYLWSLSGNQSVAEDVSQYCWLRLMEGDSQSGYQPRAGASLLSYLRTLGRNRFIDEYIRKHGEARTDSVSEDDTRLTDPVSAMDGAASAELRNSIEAAVSNLPFDQRDVLSMWLQGFSIREMMKVTEAPRDTVLSRKKYAIKKLKVVFELAGVQINDITN